MALRIKTDATITLKIDKLGRIVIPQAVRERLGLRPGSTLKLVQESDDAIYLEPVVEKAKIVYKNGWPVIVAPSRGTGETDIKKLINEVYEERALRHGGYHLKK